MMGTSGFTRAFISNKYTIGIWKTIGSMMVIYAYRSLRLIHMSMMKLKIGLLSKIKYLCTRGERNEIS